MNQHLPEEIYSIICSLDTSEIKAFENFSKRKKALDGKEHNYVKLFRLYHQQSQESLDTEKLRRDADFTKSVNDLNKKLHSELMLFLAEAYRNSNESKNEIAINDLVDSATILMNKKLFSAAINNLYKAIEILKEHNPQGHDNKILYLSLKVCALLFDYKLQRNIKEKDRNLNESLEEFFRPFLRLAQTAHQVFVVKDENYSNVFGSDDFRGQSFYGLLSIYIRETKHYDAIFKKNPGFISYGKLLDKHFPIGEERTRDAEKAEQLEKIIDSNSTLILLEELFAAIIINNEGAFEHALIELQNRTFNHNSSDTFNYYLAILMYRHIFEMKVIFELGKTEKPDIYKLQRLDEIIRHDLFLFQEIELTNFALRVELNSLVILFMERNFKDVLSRIEQWEKEIKIKRYAEYYADILLMEIISRLELGGIYDEELEKGLNYYANFGKKNKDSVPEFHKKFDGFIRKFLDASSDEERKGVCNKYISKLTESKETFNHFHHLFLMWVKKYSK